MNHPTRRQLLQTSAATGAAALALGGCEEVISRVATRLGDELPAAVALPAAQQVDPAYHLLSRAAFGPRPGDVEAVRATGTAAWVEQQLKPESIDDTACALRARRFETAHHQPGTCYEYKKPVLREEMARHTLLRAVYSRRQLFEVMVGFWGDHLNVNIEKGDCIYLKPHDDREVVRRHALGNFRDLIRASVTSPAMLVYLDGKENVRQKSATPSNENYARELLELHTLGVDGGYTQRDVNEVARCLTGWRLRTGMRKGTVYLDPELHDDGEKVVLGKTVPAGQGGGKDLQQVVDIVCRHPSTARHVAAKLARRFVAEPPPETLVVRLAEVFVRTEGDNKEVLRALLNSPEFAASAGAKFKTPFRFVVSALRAVGADTHAHADLIDYLGAMGQGVFQHPTPDGYPDEAAAWSGTLLWRWNFAFALAAGQVPSVNVSLAKLRAALDAGAGGAPAGTGEERAFRYLLGRSPGASEGAALAEGSAALRAAGNSGDAGLLGLLLASPGFQRH